MGRSHLPLKLSQKCAASTGYCCNAPSQIKCPEGYFCTGNTDEKTACPDNTVSKESSAVKTDCVCKTGFMGSDWRSVLDLVNSRRLQEVYPAMDLALALSPTTSDGMEKDDLMSLQGCHHSPFVQKGRLLADFRISRLRFAFSRLRFAWVSLGVVCGADPGSGLH
jgi:hypothetical protein